MWYVSSHLGAPGGDKSEFEIDVVRLRFQEPAKLHRPFAGEALGVRSANEQPRLVKESGRGGGAQRFHAIIAFVGIPFSGPSPFALILLCRQIPL